VVFGQSLGRTSARWLFFLGVLTGVAVILGLGMLFAGLGRRGSTAVARHRQRNETASVCHERDDLQTDNEQLRQRLDAAPAVDEEPLDDEQ
jgi:hypothetical protein